MPWSMCQSSCPLTSDEERAIWQPVAKSVTSRRKPWLSYCKALRSGEKMKCVSGAGSKNRISARRILPCSVAAPPLRRRETPRERAASLGSDRDANVVSDANDFALQHGSRNSAVAA